MLKILMADDHAIFRRGTRELIIEYDTSLMIDEAASGDDMLGLARQHPYDLFIMDLTMPGTSGVALVRALREVQPSTPVLVFSMHPASMYANAMLEAGASGYLTKATSPAELVNAIETIVGGGRYVS
jgi:DNA-binding NarL/FixJ family response regulator